MRSEAKKNGAIVPELESARVKCAELQAEAERSREKTNEFSARDGARPQDRRGCCRRSRGGGGRRRLRKRRGRRRRRRPPGSTSSAAASPAHRDDGRRRRRCRKTQPGKHDRAARARSVHVADHTGRVRGRVSSEGGAVERQAVSGERARYGAAFIRARRYYVYVICRLYFCSDASRRRRHRAARGASAARVPYPTLPSSCRISRSFSARTPRGARTATGAPAASPAGRTGRGLFAPRWFSSSPPPSGARSRDSGARRSPLHAQRLGGAAGTSRGPRGPEAGERKKKTRERLALSRSFRHFRNASPFVAHAGEIDAGGGRGGMRSPVRRFRHPRAPPLHGEAPVGGTSSVSSAFVDRGAGVDRDDVLRAVASARRRCSRRRRGAR